MHTSGTSAMTSWIACQYAVLVTCSKRSMSVRRSANGQSAVMPQFCPWGPNGSGGAPIDKALLSLAGQPMIAHVIARLGCARAISANGDPARFAPFGLPVLADGVPDRPGPLAGVLAGMDWAAAQGFRRVVTAAADTPFAPRDLAGENPDVSKRPHLPDDVPTVSEREARS